MLDSLYKLAWTSGLKTTYYLRSLGATHIEKNSDDARQVEQVTAVAAVDEEFALAESQQAAKFCSILDPECEACQ